MSSLNNQRISLLGSGWLGLPLAKELQQLSYSIKVSTRSLNKQALLESDGLTSCLYDIESTLNNDELLETDILIINITSKIVSDYERLISCIERSPISRVLFISSTSVYQDSETPESAEVCELDEHKLKSCPLLDIENLFLNNSNFQTSIIRFAGLIGYQRHPGRFFIQKQEDGSLFCKPIRNPEARVNMIHRDDCIGMIKALIQQECWGEIFNGCSSHHPTRREFYSAAIEDSANIQATFIEDEIKSYKTINNRKLIDKLNYQYQIEDLLDFESMPFQSL